MNLFNLVGRVLIGAFINVFIVSAVFANAPSFDPLPAPAEPSTPLILVEDISGAFLYDENVSLPWAVEGKLMATQDDFSPGMLEQVDFYTVLVPEEYQLLIRDRPNGQMLGAFNTWDDGIRVKYYYFEEETEVVWAGVCYAWGSQCGWVLAEYLAIIPPNLDEVYVYSIKETEAQFFSQPIFSSPAKDSYYFGNMVIVIRHYNGHDDGWAQICRFNQCGFWIPLRNLTLEYGVYNYDY